MKTHDYYIFSVYGLTDVEARDLIEKALKTGVHSQEELIKAMSKTKKGEWLSQNVKYQGYGRYTVIANCVTRTDEELNESIINAQQGKKKWYHDFAKVIIEEKCSLKF